MHEIKIYGYISNVAEQSEKEVSLLDVQQQLKDANGKPIICRINSHGGDAEEGFAIYYELRRYAKENKVKVKTFAESRLGSIATIIFLAGDERELTTDLQPFVHKAFFDTDEEISDKQKAELEVLNKRLATHYANHTELTYDEAYALMDADTFIDTEMALSMRFCTSIEQVLRPVALKRFINPQLKSNMKNKNQKMNILARTASFLKSLVAENKVVYTADDKELDFTNLEEDEIIEVGAYAEVDGSPASGEYVMTDGKHYIFDDAGMLTEIKDPEDDTASEEMVALKAENEQLKASLEEVLASAETLKAENKAQSVIIANAKLTTSKPAPNADKPNGKETPSAKTTEASKATANFNKFKTK